jgi:ribose-phosphate pyrophosphokinase
MGSSSEVFSLDNRVAPLGIVTMRGAEELGNKIEQHLLRWANRAGLNVDSFAIENNCPRFSSGDGKGIINSTVRGYDLFFIVDVGNYSCTYPYFGQENRMSPDDHFQDLKRLIQATSGKAFRMNVIMPTLYGGRQHRRSYRESLDCAQALHELHQMGVTNVVTFDAHDPRVQNAVPLMSFDNLNPAYQVLKTLFKNFPDISIERDHFMVISPDEGALDRNMLYASELGVEMGMFYKRRDYSRVVHGRNPIMAHEYMGADLKGKDVFIADDLISSGESVLDIVYNLQERQAGRIFAYATYGLFTNGLEKFDKAYQEGVITGIFGSNLTYRSEELKNRPWFYEVDVSKYGAYFISALNHNMSVSAMIDPHEKIHKLLEKRKADRAEKMDEQLTFGK